MIGRRWRGRATWYPGGPSPRCPSARRGSQNGAMAIPAGVGLSRARRASSARGGINHPAGVRRAPPGPKPTVSPPVGQTCRTPRPSPQSHRRLAAPASVWPTAHALRRCGPPARPSAPHPTIFLAKRRALVCSRSPWRLRGPTFQRPTYELGLHALPASARPVRRGGAARSDSRARRGGRLHVGGRSQ